MDSTKIIKVGYLVRLRKGERFSILFFSLPLILKPLYHFGYTSLHHKSLDCQLIGKFISGNLMKVIPHLYP